MSVREPAVISRDNDLTFEVGPIRGRDPADNVVKNWTGTQLQAWIVLDPASDTALGSITLTVNAISNATFVVSFEATQINGILTAAGTPTALVEGQSMACVLKGTGDLRRYIPLIYRAALRTAE